MMAVDENGKIIETAKEMNIDLDNLAEEDVAMIAIKWGNYDDPNVENKHRAKHYIMRN